MTTLTTLYALAGLGGLTLILLLVTLVKLGSLGRGREVERTRFDGMERGQERLESAMREEIARTRHDASELAKISRDESRENLKVFGETTETRLNSMRETIETRLRTIQEDSGVRLEKIRGTVEEKLHTTLEEKLGRSFKQITDQLERVQAGLGEMRTLATGVGDLMKAINSVSARGVWGEAQLASLLSETLAPDQYITNARIKPDTTERVEFAIKLPGGDMGPVLMPIDSKFPLTDFQKMLDADEAGDIEAFKEAGKALEIRIKQEARRIREKYIDPPATTEFAVMFLPTEGLYAEVLKRPGLFDHLHSEYRVTVAGPTTLSALLNSLRLGFQTLAIEKRSSEVWELLGVVRTEFSKFSEKLDKARKKIGEAEASIGEVETRTRVMERKIKKIEEISFEGEDNGRVQ